MAENANSVDPAPDSEQNFKPISKMSFASVAAMAPPAKVPKAQLESAAAVKPEGVSDPSSSLGISNKANINRVADDSRSLRDSFHRLEVREHQTQASEIVENDGQVASHLRQRLDDEKTHLSISSTAALSLDGKSVTSVTTFALDEKESIRPDDSASVKAAEDDDSNSGPVSGDPNSRMGSDAGGKAFRDQFNEVSERIVPTHMRNLQWSRRLAPGTAEELRRGPLPSPQSLNNGLAGLPRPEPHINSNTMIYSYQEPDEKLLEAMQNPKDRLFLLQLEKQVISFIQDSNDPLLDLPPCNSFYRLLAHRLGDYYALSHFVDNSVSAVRLYRTPYCQLRTPLGEIAQKLAANDDSRTVPPSMKIMRRIDTASEGQAPSSGANTNDPSANASKAASEVGDDGFKQWSITSPAGSTTAKDKAPITREEREAKYKEARERIFADYKEGERPDQTIVEDSGMASSRASSTTSKKKKKAKPHDDGFDSRSAYNLYYPGLRSGPIYDQVASPIAYYHPYMQQTSGMVSPIAYQQPCQQYAPMPPVTHMAPYQYPSHPQFHVAAAPNMYQSGSSHQFSPQYPQPSRPPYYASAQQPNAVSNVPHSMPSPALSTHSSHSSRPQSQMSEQAWSPSGYSYSFNHHHGAPALYAAPPHPGPQPPNPTSPSGYNIATVPYAYGQLPYQPNGHNSRPSHPIPGSYNRQNFNPHSKVFIPGQGQGAESTPVSVHRSLSPSVPYVQYQNQETDVQLAMGMAASQPSRNGSGPGQAQQSPPRSTISKWATPATLPPKPPPPASSTTPQGSGSTETVPTYQNGMYSQPTNSHPKA